MRRFAVLLVVLAALIGPATAYATDTTPPFAPSGVKIVAKSANQAILVWNVAADIGGSGIWYYEVACSCQTGYTNADPNDYGGGPYTMTWGSSGGPLFPSTSYTWNVRARDNAGNIGTWSTQASATTLSSGTETIVGAVLSSSSGPVLAGATVTAQDYNSPYTVREQTTTDAGGIYTLTQLCGNCGNSYQINYTKTGYYSTGYGLNPLVIPNGEIKIMPNAVMPPI